MKKQLRVVMWCAGALLLAVPASVALTIVLYPLWSWIEASWGIESLGHSGPALWCYGLTLALLSALLIAVVLLRNRSSTSAAIVKR